MLRKDRPTQSELEILYTYSRGIPHNVLFFVKLNRSAAYDIYSLF